MKKSLRLKFQSPNSDFLRGVNSYSLTTVKFSLRLGVFALIMFVLANSAFSQKRDNLTNEEDLIVRDAQEINLRMEVFVKIIDRRLSALTDANAAQSKAAQKDANKWGEPRTGTRAELFFDIEKTLSEAIGKIDDVAERDQKNPLFPKAVRILANACQRFLPEFKSFQNKTALSEKEKMLIANSIDDCNQIIEASAKVPKEAPKEKKKKKS